MWNKLYNYFFFNPTHKITDYPISTVNGLKCEVLSSVGGYDAIFYHQNRVYIRLEKKIPRNSGREERDIILHKKYLEPITIPKPTAGL